MRPRFLLIIALGLGLLFAYVDTRPNWDDTGVIAMAVAISCAILGALEPRRPWLWAIAVGIWLPLADMILHHNFGALLALLFAFGGAYAGMVLRRVLAPV